MAENFSAHARIHNVDLHAGIRALALHALENLRARIHVRNGIHAILLALGTHAWNLVYHKCYDL